MDGWTNVGGCSANFDYACLTQFGPGQIPNLTRLARHFAISDRTFQMDSVSSWGAHLELVAGTLDGFVGDRIPRGDGLKGQALGWGCDSGLDATWRPSPGGPVSQVPACVPDYWLDSTHYPYGGAYRPTPVNHVPTLMDEFDRAGVSWRLYSATRPGLNGYGLAICPTFAGCLYTSQHNHQVGRGKVLRDAAKGRLPNFSIVLPELERIAAQRGLDGDAATTGSAGSSERSRTAPTGAPPRSSSPTTIAAASTTTFRRRPAWASGRRWSSSARGSSRATTDSARPRSPRCMAFAERTFDLPALTERDAAAYSLPPTPSTSISDRLHRSPMTRVEGPRGRAQGESSGRTPGQDLSDAPRG